MVLASDFNNDFAVQVRWFYNMHSSHSHDVGKLRVIYKDVSNQQEKILWQIQGNQGRYWKFGSVTFDITSFLYQVRHLGVSFKVRIVLKGVHSFFRYQEHEKSNSYQKPNGKICFLFPSLYISVVICYEAFFILSILPKCQVDIWTLRSFC